MMSTLSLAVPAYPQVVLETSWRRRRIRALRDARCRRKRQPASAANFSHGQRIARHQGHDHIGARRIADQGTVQIRLSVRQIFSLLVSTTIAIRCDAFDVRHETAKAGTAERNLAAATVENSC